ncbi:winged helix-turn-helix domain-containing protein [Haloferax larsenii]|uniref:Winged helix-turn-helix domain-containing protein n=1 Tax=Haloferax larsenii TaxID=302484 RepID=A0ABY5RHX4_HALLR|nr:phage PhiH1 repressor protein [Haloferax larsenii]ELZ79592.1 phage PhiH1 repressor protein [Haloferax larsenii JCM 13917]UVE50750.1 winged helix-turn-helix domain-containing protein [Haloferax larsenii]
MKLAVPTDFDILEALSDGRRNTAVNLSYILDRNRSYINTRLPILADYGLLDRVGPAPNSGLYEITDKGRVVAGHRDQYRTEGVDFDDLVESKLRARSNGTTDE